MGKNLIYVSIPKFTKVEIEQALIEDDIEKLIFVPLFASLYYEDRDFAEEICIKLSQHSHFNIRAMAIEGFGHIARIDRKLNEEIIKPIIEKAFKVEDDFVRAKAEDSIDDIEHFLKWKFNQ